MDIRVPKFLKSVKYILAEVNGLFVLTGTLLLIVGVVVLAKNAEYTELITNRFYTIPGFAIAIGVIILFISLLGFYAAMSEKFYFIAAYAVLMIVILIFELALTITAYEIESDASSEIRPTMVASVQLYESRREIARIWDELHMNFECCGAVSVNDWNWSRIPVSCCHIDYGTISPFDCTLADAYKTGCISALGAWLSHNAHVLAVTALVVTCIQVLLTAIAGWQAWRSKFETVQLES